MKRLLLLGVLAALILTPVAPLVNAPICNDSPHAVGVLLPPFPLGGGHTIADGDPLPPPWPPGGNVSV